MNMGCGTYLFLMTWGMGIFCIVGSFIVNPRSQAPMFFQIGVAFLVAAIFWTRSMINAPKRKAEEEKAKKRGEQTKREQEEKTLAHMEGLEKFHYMDTEDARKYQEGFAAIRELGVIMQQSVYQEKKKDWAILGGIADGIAGPAAGLVTAVNAVNDNAKIEAENAARREWGAKQNAFYRDLAMQAERERPRALSMTELQKKYTTLLSWSPATLVSLIRFSDTNADIDEQTGAVLVSTAWQQKNKSICIDGALRAKLYTSSGECAGCAYLVLPKTGTAGFNGELSGICASPKKSDSYTVQIEPVDLWELTSKENAKPRITDYLTDYEHRQLVSDYEAKYLSELRN